MDNPLPGKLDLARPGLLRFVGVLTLETLSPDTRQDNLEDSVSALLSARDEEFVGCREITAQYLKYYN